MLFYPAAAQHAVAIVEHGALARRDRPLWLVKVNLNARGIGGWRERGGGRHMLVTNADVSALPVFAVGEMTTPTTPVTSVVAARMACSGLEPFSLANRFWIVPVTVSLAMVVVIAVPAAKFCDAL